MRTQAVRAVSVAAALLIGLAACTSGSSSDEAAPSPAPSRSAPATTGAASSSYVALGDSFTAGPGIDPQQAGAGYCQRSEQDWPTLAASSLGLDLTDVSCSGATTSDLVGTVDAGAVPPGTGLVTVSAGGNDSGLFISLIRACSTGADDCRTFVDQQAPAILDRTTTDLAALLRTVRSDAPDATVALVGYPRIMPTRGTCATVGIDAAQVESVVSAETALDAALAAAADRAGVTYVSARAASEGHDACAGDQAWTNGTAPAAGDGIVFHPNRRGMAAMAGLVAAALGT